MAIGVSKQVPRKYILEEDRDLPAEQQTVFHVRALSYAEFTNLTSEANATDPDDEMRGLSLFEGAVRTAFSGWDNLLDPDGGVISPPEGIDARLQLLTFAQAIELGKAIIEFSSPTLEDEGKSGSRSASDSESSEPEPASPAANSKTD